MAFEDPRPVLEHLRYVESLVWVDNDRLAFTGVVEGRDEPRVWLLSVGSGELTELHDVGLDGLSVSPDRSELAGIASGDDELDQVVIVTLPSPS